MVVPSEFRSVSRHVRIHFAGPAVNPAREIQQIRETVTFQKKGNLLAAPSVMADHHGFRIRGNDFLMTPTPTAAPLIAPITGLWLS